MKRFRIVLIEPNPADARWMELALQDAGAAVEVSKFPSVIQTLSTLRMHDESCADLVILNSTMPFMEAFQGIERLKSLPCLDRVPIAVTIVMDHERQLVKGNQFILKKPVDSQQISELLDHLQPAWRAAPPCDN